MSDEKITLKYEIDTEMLVDLKRIAKKDGKTVSLVVDDAIKCYVSKKRPGFPRKSILIAFDQSLNRYEDIYRALVD